MPRVGMGLERYEASEKTPCFHKLPSREELMSSWLHAWTGHIVPYPHPDFRNRTRIMQTYCSSPATLSLQDPGQDVLQRLVL